MFIWACGKALFLCYYLISWIFHWYFLYMGNNWIFYVYYFFCVGLGKTTLMFFSDGLDPYIFRQKMEETRPMREEKMERCLLPAIVGLFSFAVNTIQEIFPLFLMIWGVNNYVSRRIKRLNRRNKIPNIVNITIIINIVNNIIVLINTFVKRLTALYWS